jgi:hypothetical protein
VISNQQEVPESIRPLLKLSRETIVRCQKTEYALVSSLERAPLLAERIKRLRTVPGVGPITALTWALEIGDVSRFRSIKQAVSYCGLCGDERSSAEKVLRTPLSKQRNKHIQSVLIEAAKLVPRQNRELALIHETRKAERECESGDTSRSPEDGRVSAGRGSPREGLKGEVRRPLKPSAAVGKRLQDYTARRLPGPAGGRLSEGAQAPEAPFGLFRDWQRTQTQSSVTALRARDSKWMSGSAKARNHCREAHVANCGF